MKEKVVFRSVVIIVVILATMITQNSCEKSGENYNRNESLNIPKEYKVIGRKHNEGLDFAFNEIRLHYAAVVTRSSTSKISPMPKDELLTLGKQAAIDFSTQNVSGVPEGFCADIINQSEKIATKSSGNTDVEVYIKMIDDVLKNEPESPDDLIEKLNKINDYASQNLSEQDAAAVYAGTVTCYNSYIYWKENFMKWVIAIKYPELLAQYSDDELNTFQFIGGKLMAPTVATRSWWDDAWSSVGETWDSISNSASNWWTNGGGKEIVAADAGGAVAGAMGGAIAGSVAGGAGAGPGAIAGSIGGGCYGSIDNAIQYWITH